MRDSSAAIWTGAVPVFWVMPCAAESLASGDGCGKKGREEGTEKGDMYPGYMSPV